MAPRMLARESWLAHARTPTCIEVPQRLDPEQAHVLHPGYKGLEGMRTELGHTPSTGLPV